MLKPWNERERTQMELLPLVQAKLEEISGLQIFGFNLPSLPGTGEGLPFQFVINTAGDYPALLDVAQRIKTRAQESGKFAFLDIDLAFDKPEVVVDIDRAKAAQMGVSMDTLGGTLATLLGEAEINRFTLEGRSYKVIAQVERPYRDNPGWLNNYYVKNDQGQLLPLSTLITLTDRARPRQLNQFQQLNAAIIQGVPMVSLGEALKTVQDIAREEAPEGFAFDCSRRGPPVCTGRQRIVGHLRPGAGDHFPRTGCTVRKLPRPVGDSGDSAVVHLWRAFAAVPGCVEHEHLHPGRAGDIDRAYQQARYPDRRVRQSATR